MTDCKCGHPDHAHLHSYDSEYGGRCQYWIIKSCSDWIPDTSLGKNIKAWTMQVEYEGQCPCEGFHTTTTKKRVKSPISLENWLPKN